MALVLSLSRDDYLTTFLPIAVYWIFSGIYMILENFNGYRIFTKDEENKKNVVPKRTVLKAVLLHQFFQIFATLVFLIYEKCTTGNNLQRQPQQPSIHVFALQVFVAMVAMDSWQYFVHRFMHVNKFLYKHVHSRHHELVASYAYGAIYSHPVEGLLLDIGGGFVAFFVSGMTPLSFAFFSSFTFIKAIDDHSSLWLPVNILHYVFKNTTAYHHIHHQPYGLKKNFSTPFFVTWDKLLGTYMAYRLEKRKDGGGIEVRPVLKRFID